MTRQEFDRRFAATLDNTEGYSEAALAEINDAVFARVADLDVTSDLADNEAKNAFTSAMNER
jgi:hypothetical protein